MATKPFLASGVAYIQLAGPSSCSLHSARNTRRVQSGMFGAVLFEVAYAFGAQRLAGPDAALPRLGKPHVIFGMRLIQPAHAKGNSD